MAMIEEIQISVELPTKLKLRLDIYGKLERKTQKEVITEALEKYLPEYYVQLKD